jgi:hypothetical protein
MCVQRKPALTFEIKLNYQNVLVLQKVDRYSCAHPQFPSQLSLSVCKYYQWYQLCVNETS